MEVTDKLLTDVEELLIASESDQGAIAKLLDIVTGIEGDFPANLKKLFTDNLEMLIADANAVKTDTPLAALVTDLADRNVDAMLLRDALAALCRQTFAEYPDPAGLIRAFAVLDEGTGILTVRSRWKAFQYLKEEAVAWHGAFGLGKVIEVDPFSDLVYIQFDRKQNFTLEQTLVAVSIARPESLADQLASNSKVAFRPSRPAPEFDIEIANSFEPPIANAVTAVEQLLVPGFMSKKDHDDWRKGSRGSGDGDQKQRTWREARSLQELKICLADVSNINPNEEQAAHLAKLFDFAASRKTLVTDFAENLAAVWSLSKDVAWIEAMIRAHEEKALIWAELSEFSVVTQKLPAKLVPSWLSATYIANGAEWLMQTTMTMPLRFYDPVDTVLKNRDHEDTLLFGFSHDTMKRAESLPDTLVWLWRRHRERAAQSFGTPRPVFRSLAAPAKGEYIKAKKELQKLLMNDQEFQTALMDGGTRDGIGRFVQIVKHAHLLNKGEKQSLLVKIVRLFPEAQDLVEDRKPVEALQKKVTSVRMLEVYRQELELIINKKIPANSAAIAHAREYGDLRENAEFKAAKENQRLLLERRSYLEKELSEIIPTDFADIEVGDMVIAGTSVVLKLDSGTRTYHILGLWDSDPEIDIISYDTEIAKVLITRNIGDSIELPGDGGKAVISEVRALPDHIREWVSAEPVAAAGV
jgi:transcription elongation GreA/GreB family factor